jgi:beta-fructofuranosidase
MTGSAIVDGDDRLTLMYSGWGSGPGLTQNIAVSDDGVRFHKSSANPVIPVAPSSTRKDFRDPQLVQIDDLTFAVIGASAISASTWSIATGRALLYRASDDLLDWTYVGVAAESSTYETMWECPDLFPLSDRFALVTSPMHGMSTATPVVEVGSFDTVAGTFIAEGRQLLDAGDFYAPHTMADSSGRRILIAWMKPKVMVTADEGWCGAMTIPRELALVDGHVLQRPVKELETLRGAAQSFGPASVGREGLQADTGLTAEVRLVLGSGNSRKCRVGVRVSPDRSEQTCFVIDRDAERVVSDRSLSGRGDLAGSVVEFEDHHSDLELRFFIDVSSVELFIDDGAAALTHWIYPAESSTGFYVESIGGGAVEILDLTIWPLEMR